MEAQPGGRQPSGPSPSSAAAYPRWVLLGRDVRCQDLDAKTVAFACTSRGHPLSVSFGLVTPPALSGLRLDKGPDLPDGVSFCSEVVAAHGDSVLIKIKTIDENARCHDASSMDGGYYMVDYFVYCAGDAAADPSRPPSLSLLPPHPKQRYMNGKTRNLLSRCGEEPLVAELVDVHVKSRGDEEGDPVEGELWVLRSGEWELKRLPVFHDEINRHEIYLWQTDTVVTVGDRFLCWVDLKGGITILDMSEETPQLRYVSLPVLPDLSYKSNHGRHCWWTSRSVCATDGGGAVKFVDVVPRCCGRPVSTTCACSCYAFTVTTWKLRTDDMAWDKDHVVDSDELWALDGYDGVIPRIRPQRPTVSLDDPDAITFLVHKRVYNSVDGEEVTRLVEVDTRRKELRSIFCYDKDDYSFMWRRLVPSKVSSYFNISRPGGGSSPSRVHPS